MRFRHFVVPLLVLTVGLLVAGCAHRLGKSPATGSVAAGLRAERVKSNGAPNAGTGAGAEATRPVSAGQTPLGPLRLPKNVIAKVVPITVTTPEARYEISTETEALKGKLVVHVVPETNALADAVAEAGARGTLAETYLGKTSTDERPDQGANLDAIGSGDRELPPATPTGGIQTTFDSLGFVDSGFIPPDPSGVAGPNHVVNTVNLQFAFHNKTTGVIEATDSLSNFFAPLSPRSLFDPKLVYDQYENRFLLVVLDASTGPNTSRILLAVSDDSDPNGTWYMTAINSLLLISSETRYADYPGMSVDEEAVYITANMFGVTSGSFVDSRIWVVRKKVGTSGGFYFGGPVTAKLLDPPDAGSQNFTLQPAHLFGIHPVTTLGTYFTAYNGISDGTNEYLRVLTVMNPLASVPTFVTEFVNIGDIEDFSTGTQAPQPLSVPIGIETSARRVFHSVWRGNVLNAVTAIVPPLGDPNANQVTAEWFQVDTTLLGSPPACQTTPLACVPDHGAIGGEDIGPGTFTYYPSIAVASSGTFTIGFAASGPDAFVGSYFAVRKPGDPPGVIGPSYLLRRGVDRYIRTFGSGRNRWGDYTGCAVDPVDECFWVYNEHALPEQAGAPLNDNGVWGTAWGKTCPDQSVCGNGIVEAGETCDSTPGCRPNCTSCGDGTLDVTETCEPPGGLCRATCSSCGDFIVQAAEGEGCDDGNSLGGDGCDAACRLEVCGNGVVQSGETCDPPGVPAGQPNVCRVNCNFCGDTVVQGSGLLANGNFESGGLVGWTVNASGAGSFGISTPGAPTPTSGNSTTGNPFGGAFYAVSDESGPGTHSLSQTFVVPATATQVILSFDMFVNDWSGSGGIIDPIGLDHTGPPNQHARVDLLHPGFGPFDTSAAAVVANYYLGVDALPAPNPYAAYSFDITADVAPGGTYVIRFANTGNQFFLNLGVDNVSVQSQPGTESCDDGNNLDGDGCSSNCEAGCGTGTASFSQPLHAPSPTGFSWTSPVDVDFIRGDLALVSTYNVIATGSLPTATAIPALDTPAPGHGFFWVVRVDCPTSTWSSGSPSEVPGRDAGFPSF